jgi:carbon-monoxide dehydrogenase large subunit
MVEVDRETGDVSIDRYVAVDDCGRVVSPLLVAGQVHGGLAQGIGQALFEEMAYDAAGSPATATLMDYPVMTAASMPSVEALQTETPSPHNPLGAKGIGEAGAIAAPPTVVSAVCDALGVEHLDMPLTRERLWRAMRSAGTD